MLIFSIFMLQAISAALCYDLQLEGVMKLGKDFLRMLTQHNSLGKQLNFNFPISYESKGKLPKNTLIEGITISKSYKRSAQNVKTTESIPLHDYLEHLKKKGTGTLKSIGKQIKKDTKSEKNITKLMKTLSDDYVTMMQDYYNLITEEAKEGKISEIDTEFIFLDMIETSNRLLYSEERKLLNYVIKDLNTTSLNITVDAINANIYKQNINSKKEEMRYVCNTYDVCRQYPAFTDYCADLISEILKLSDDKFKIFLDQITQIFYEKSKNDFFATISEKEDRNTMLTKLQSYAGDLFAMKELLAVLRAVITQRFKVVHTNKEKVRIRTKATRILLDIIDKALCLDEDVLTIDFDTTMTAIRNWSGGKRDSIEGILNEFANHSIKMLDHNLSPNARQEISVLIEVIMRGRTKKEEMYQSLFKYGSKFVLDEEFQSDLEIF